MAETQILIGTAEKPVRLSYVWLNEPQPAKEGEGKAKYGVSILIEKSDKAMVAKIKAAIEAAKLAGKSKLDSMKGILEEALKDGDLKDDPNYEGHYYISARADNKPNIVSRHKDENGKFIPITDASEIYSGMWGICSVTFYAFAIKKRGIACGLNNVMKVKNGEAFGSRTTADQDFEGLEIDDSIGEDENDFI